jgi:hypothetical protein
MLARRLAKAEAALRRRTAGESPVLVRIRQDPARILTEAGVTPDPWQAAALRCSSVRICMLASRQAGKSLAAGALALFTALAFARSLVLILSPSQRQSGEIFYDKVVSLYQRLGRPMEATAESALRLSLANSSRVIALPSTEATIRCFAGVRLLVVDEAARVPDPLYHAVRPMLATSGGRLVLLSTAFGKQGFFFREWTEGGPEWQRFRVRADECRRIPASFLAEERLVLGPRLYAREYEGEFSSADDAVFDYDSVRAAMTPGGEEPLF